MSEATLIQAVGDLQGTVRTMTDQWRDQEKQATDGRRILHEKFETMSSQLAQLTGQVVGVKEDVAAVKKDLADRVMPIVTDYQLEQARRRGLISAGRAFWIFITAVLGTAGYWLHQIIQSFTGKP